MQCTYTECLNGVLNIKAHQSILMNFIYVTSVTIKNVSKGTFLKPQIFHQQWQEKLILRKKTPYGWSIELVASRVNRNKKVDMGRKIPNQFNDHHSNQPINQMTKEEYSIYCN